MEDFKLHLKEFSESEPESEVEIDEEISILEEGRKKTEGDLALKRKEIRDIRSENELQELLLEKESLIGWSLLGLLACLLGIILTQII